MSPPVCAQRGVSFLPGRSAPRTKDQIHSKPATPAKPFDKKAWHARKAAEARARIKQEKQVRTCYAQYTPPQVKELERSIAPPTLNKAQENIARLMTSNRGQGL